MAHARYYKTLFVPSLEGQHLLWKNEIVKIATRVDEIVQLGNIIGTSEEMKDTANYGSNLATMNYTLLWRATFSNWTQIIGPNEILALNFPEEWTNKKTNKLLRERWFSKETAGAYQTASVNKNRLVTHGGLTYGEWVNIGKPETAQEAADLLNKKYNGSLYQGECYRLDGKPSYAANPIFADPLWELYGSWVTAHEDPPFGQIHGSGGLNTIEGRQALTAPYSVLNHIDNASYTNFGSIITIKGKPFFSVSPDIPKDKIIRRMIRPWQVYIEKVPVVDLRDELFEDDSE